MRYFCVFDKVAGVFLQLFPAANRGVAIRMIGDAAADPQGQFAKHLSDYELWEVAAFDPETGNLTQEGLPQKCIWLAEFENRP